ALKHVGVRATDELPFDSQGFTLFEDGFQCDSDGNVYFLPGAPGEMRSPPLVVRVPADGKRARRLSVPAMLRAGSADVLVKAMALDPGGDLHLLIDVRTERDLRQSIISVDAEGQVGTRLELDPDEIVARQFGVFDSGDFLILGYRGERAEPRLAVLASSGGSFRDVSPPTTPGA